MNGLRKVPLYAAGLIIMAFGFALILRCGLGNDTVGVLAHGMSLQTGMSIGNGSQIVNLSALLIVLIGNRRLIGVGSVISAVAIGFILDLWLAVVPFSAGGVWSSIYLLFGVSLAGIGIAMTIRSGFGASPIDALMLLLASNSRISMRIIRISMDVCIAGAGWLLGGLVGLGTIVTVLCIGPIIQLTLHIWAKLANERISADEAS